MEKFIDKFAKVIADENLMPELDYNADETSLSSCYSPGKTLTPDDDTAPTGIKNAKDRITVLGYANAAGMHKCKFVDRQNLASLLFSRSKIFYQSIIMLTKRHGSQGLFFLFGFPIILFQQLVVENAGKLDWMMTGRFWYSLTTVLLTFQLKFH